MGVRLILNKWRPESQKRVQTIGGGTSGALPDIDQLRERFAPRTPQMPEVQVVLPATAVYDQLLEAV